MIPTAAPATGAAAITPSNDANLATETRALLVGVAGNVRVTTKDGDDVVLTGLLAGNVYPICVVKVWATSTTATNIVGLW